MSGLNTGAKAPIALKVIKQSFFVYRFADDGTQNCIPAGTTIDSNYITARLNDADASKRWYPVGLYKNVAPTDKAITTESYNDGSTTVTTLTPASFSGFLVDADTSQLDPINQLNCEEVGVFEIDACGRLVGYVEDSSGACSCDAIGAYDATENLYPIPVTTSYPQALYVKATDTTSSKINVIYEYDQAYRIGAWKYAEATGVNLLSVKGLYDVSGTPSNEAAIGFTITAVVRSSKFGTSAQIPAQGFELADFTLVKSDGSPIVITSVTESAAGVYDFVIPSNPAEILTLTASKTGFNWCATTIETP